MKILFEKTKILLDELSHVFQYLSDEEFTIKIALLNQVTIGQHTRHILEFFTCLISSKETKMLDYDLRKRNVLIENNKSVALDTVDYILENIDIIENINLQLSQSYNFGKQTIDTSIETTYFREWVYNIEHTIHHQAIMRIAIADLLPNFKIPATFGVADSTINYKKQCVH